MQTESQLQQNFQKSNNETVNNNQNIANEYLKKLSKSLRETLPQSFYTGKVVTHLQQIKSTVLYQLLDQAPKAVMHHNHLQCNDDYQFYRKYIYTDPRIYLTADLENFQIGTQEQAKENKWVSLKELANNGNFKSEEQIINFLYRKVAFNIQDHKTLSGTPQAWPQFQKRIQKFFPLIWSQHIFQPYTLHILQKLASNNHQRIQFRAYIAELQSYSPEGVLLQKQPRSRYLSIIDQCVQQVRKDYPRFDVGVIAVGIKAFGEANQEYFGEVLECRSGRCVGVDFVNQEDLFGSIDKYDAILQQIFTQKPQLRVPKVYHAGQSNSPTNNNIQLAIQYGTKRIGHGLNLLNQQHLIPKLNNICFELNPISNLVLNYTADSRKSVANIFKQHNIPFTISSDDPGKFGYENTTPDFFVSYVSFGWEISDFKRVLLWSIEYSLCDKQQKLALFQEFETRWQQWIRFVAQYAEKDMQLVTNQSS